MKEKDDKDSIQNIFMGLRSSLARAVMGLVPPREVEDIVQETYVRVCQINRQQIGCDIGNACVPLERGDQPHRTLTRESDNTCSPRTWGSTDAPMS